MKKIVAIASATTIAVFFGLLSIGYSPVTCGCIDPLMSLAFDAGMDRIDSRTDLSAPSIEAGLNRTMTGKRVVFGQYPYTADEGCEQPGEALVVCRIPIEESPLLARGYRVTYQLRDGHFQKAAVRSSRWLRR